VERRGEAVGGPFEKLVPWLSTLVEVGTVLQKPGPDDGDVGASRLSYCQATRTLTIKSDIAKPPRKTSGFGAKMHVRPIGFKTPPPRSSRHDFKYMQDPTMHLRPVPGPPTQIMHLSFHEAVGLALLYTFISIPNFAIH
jgi:hypothetical protein